MLAANSFFGLLGRTGRDLPGNIEPTEENLKAYEQGVDVRNKLASMSLEDAKNDDSTASSIIFHPDYVPDSREVQNQKQSLRSAGFSDTALWNLPDNVEAAAYYVKPGQFDAKELPYNMVGLGATNYGVDLDNVTDRFQNIWETYGQYAEGVKPWSESPIPESEAKMGGNKSIWNGMKDFLGPQGSGSRGRYGPEAAAAYENYLKTGQISDALPVGFAFDAFDYGGRYTGNKFQNKKGSIFDRFVAPVLTAGATIFNPYLGMATAAGIGAAQGKSPGEIALNAGQAFVGGGGLNPTTALQRGVITAGNTAVTGARTDFDPLSMGLTAGTTYLGNAPEIPTTATDYLNPTADIPDPLFPDGSSVSTNLTNDSFVPPTSNPFNYVGTSSVPGFSSVIPPTVDIPASTTSLSPTAPGQGFVSPDYSLPIPTAEEGLTNSLFPEGGTAEATLQNNINPTTLVNNTFTAPTIPDPTVDSLFGEGQFNVNNPFVEQPDYSKFIDPAFESLDTLPNDSILDKIKDNPFEATRLALGLAGEFLPDGTATASGNPFDMPKAPAVTGRQPITYELGYTPMQFTPINYRSFYNPFMGA
jgi:hypothetical protein